jgi:hypothetical protein
MPDKPADGGLTPEDSVFHIFLYSLSQSFVYVVDYLAATILPDYSQVVKIDFEIRRIETAAPAWLKWSDFEGNAGRFNLSQKHMFQQHSATMFFHKGLLSELPPAAQMS